MNIENKKRVKVYSKFIFVDHKESIDTDFIVENILKKNRCLRIDLEIFDKVDEKTNTYTTSSTTHHYSFNPVEFPVMNINFIEMLKQLFLRTRSIIILYV